MAADQEHERSVLIVSRTKSIFAAPAVVLRFLALRSRMFARLALLRDNVLKSTTNIVSDPHISSNLGTSLYNRKSESLNYPVRQKQLISLDVG